MDRIVELRPLSRNDVRRVAQWLQDDAVASLWFGRYPTGEPVHLGYLPHEMLKASEIEFYRVLTDRHRRIYSIYDSILGHIGEAHLVDEEALGNVELALLIGRRDLWGQGYGKAAFSEMLSLAFDQLERQRSWVDVPEDNVRALRLCESVGFQVEGRLRQSRPRPNGQRVDSIVMGLLAEEYYRRLEQERGEEELVVGVA